MNVEEPPSHAMEPWSAPEVSALVRTLSHDLRSSLTAISMTTGLLKRKQELPEQWHRPLDRMERAVIQMEQQIRLAQDFAMLRLGDLPLEIQSHSLQELLSRCLTFFHPLAAECQVSFDLTLQAVSVSVDEHRFHAALFSLLKTALKHCTNGQTLYVAAAVSASAIEVLIQQESAELKSRLMLVEGDIAAVEVSERLNLRMAAALLAAQGATLWWDPQRLEAGPLLIKFPLA